MVISFQQNDTDSKLFAKRKLFEIRFLLALVLALCFLVVDARRTLLNDFRRALSCAITPLQLIVNYPKILSKNIHDFLSTQNNLLLENQALLEKTIFLNSQIQKTHALAKENIQLRKLLSTKKSISNKVMAAHIIAVASNSARQLVVLDVGTKNGVYVGLPVIDANGVMGQIIDVGLMTSTLLLISDSKSAVPVSDIRTGERAILMGTNHDSYLSMINLPKSSKIAKGDLLVTSGLGRRYPEGYPVGKVIEVNHAPGEEFIRVTAKPLAVLHKSRWVLLLWPDQNDNQITYQIHQRLKVLEGLA